MGVALRLERRFLDKALHSGRDTFVVDKLSLKSRVIPIFIHATFSMSLLPAHKHQNRTSSPDHSFSHKSSSISSVLKGTKEPSTPVRKLTFWNVDACPLLCSPFFHWNHRRPASFDVAVVSMLPNSGYIRPHRGNEAPLARLPV